MMNKYTPVRIMLAAAVFMAAFAAIEGLGSYLVAQLSRFDETAQIMEAPSEPKVIKRQTLRLAPESYYMLQVGSFADAALGQEIIDQLAQNGYRIYAKEGPPYKLWLGCFADKAGLAEIPDVVKTYGQDIFVVSGILNEVALTFDENQIFIKEQLTPIIGAIDVMLKHSLKMFQKTTYAQYPDDIWQQMIAKIDDEITGIATEIERVLLEEESKPLAKALVDLGEGLENYRQSLLMVAEKKNDQMVLLAQSYLQQVIGDYHGLIRWANQIEAQS